MRRSAANVFSAQGREVPARQKERSVKDDDRRKDFMLNERTRDSNV